LSEPRITKKKKRRGDAADVREALGVKASG